MQIGYRHTIFVGISLFPAILLCEPTRRMFVINPMQQSYYIRQFHANLTANPFAFDFLMGDNRPYGTIWMYRTLVELMSGLAEYREFITDVNLL